MAIYLIQIQHLLKLNEGGGKTSGQKTWIQIQHLLKLNLNIYMLILSFLANSNTTLVKVKYMLTVYVYLKDKFKYNTC